jgi:uncharacterized protein YhaN
MHHPALSLLSLQDRSCAPEKRKLNTQRVIAALGLAGTLSIAMLLVGMPLISMGIVAAASTVFVVRSKAAAAARALRQAALPMPEAVASLELREVYRGILATYEEIERSVTDARRLRSAIGAILERCISAIEMCGRLALLANPLHHHLAVHDAKGLRAEIGRLQARCDGLADEDAAKVLRGAVAARKRELANLDHMAVMRDRIHARLEVCRASFAAFAATVVKLHVADEEQLGLATGTLNEHLDGVSDKLEIMESVLGVEPEATSRSLAPSGEASGG